MLSFSFWSLCEGLANWGIFWFDTFLIIYAYSEYYVGIYKNSANMVMSLMGMISASMSPVLLSSLSRVKNDRKKFHNLFLSIHRLMLYLIFPTGVGLFCYKNIVTYILFGNKWIEATDIISSWGLMMMCSLAFYTFPAELYKSKGIPKVLFLFQLCYLFFMIPVCIFSLKYEFITFVYIRCFCVVEQMIVSLILMKYTFHFSIIQILKNMTMPALASLGILISYWIFRGHINTYIHEFLFMILSALIYAIALGVFFQKDIRKLLKQVKL
ncbi:colanic acid exporter [Fusobacterium necrophorum subsp. necrophorum]|nr:colanic acid exporter [Fusobacterium necrophorum subsp. necrophorum]